MEDSTIKSLTNYIASFVSISEHDISLLTHVFKRERFLKGSILETENTVAKKLYFIQHGFVRVFCDEDGVEITTQIVGENNFVTGFKSFVSGEVSRVSIRCVTDCEVLFVNKLEYNKLSTCVSNWSVFCKQVYEYSLEFNLQRTTDLLSLSAEKRYLKLLTQQPEVIKNVPIQYIASYIGIKPESLSRIRKKIIS